MEGEVGVIFVRVWNRSFVDSYSECAASSKANVYHTILSGLLGHFRALSIEDLVPCVSVTLRRWAADFLKFEGVSDSWDLITV